MTHADLAKGELDAEPRGPQRMTREGVIPTVTLYGRAGCCLCDEAREILLSVRATHPFVLKEQDIDLDDSLLRAYLERIPVVTIDGVEAFALFVDQAELEQRLG